jgi:WD40 repeat protein
LKASGRRFSLSLPCVGLRAGVQHRKKQFVLDVPDHSLENIALFIQHYYAQELVDESRFIAKTYAESSQVHSSLPLADIQSSYAFLAPFFKTQPLQDSQLIELPNPHGRTNVHLLLVYNASTLTKEDQSPLSYISKFLFLLRFFREYVPVDCVSFLSYDISSYRSFTSDPTLRVYLLHGEKQAKKYNRLDIKATIVEVLRLIGFRDKRIKNIKIKEDDRSYLGSIKDITSFIADNINPRIVPPTILPETDIDL